MSHSTKPRIGLGAFDFPQNLPRFFSLQSADDFFAERQFGRRSEFRKHFGASMARAAAKKPNGNPAIDGIFKGIGAPAKRFHWPTANNLSKREAETNQ